MKNILGQKQTRDCLVIEIDKNNKGYEVVSWPNLPRMIVLAAAEDEAILESANRFNNVIGITVESVYNVPKYVSEGTLFDAIFMLPCFDDVRINFAVLFLSIMKGYKMSNVDVMLTHTLEL